MTIFKCEACDKESEYNIRIKRFCSKECRHIYINSKKCSKKVKVKQCYMCKKEYSHKANKRFCSKKCYNVYLTEQNPLKKELKKVNCKNCKEDFFVANYIKPEYCSRKCYWDYYRKNGLFKLKAEKSITRVWKVCKNCKKDFWLHKYRGNEGIFCTKKCHDDFRRSDIKCPSCKKIFTSPQYENRKYCSTECAFKGIGKRKSQFHISVSDFLKRLVKKGYSIKIDQEKTTNIDNRKLSPDFIINDVLVIECYGDYWHCNPEVYSGEYYHSKVQKTAKDMWDYDRERERILEKNYKLIVVWEKDWNEKRRMTFKKIGEKIDEILKS